MAKKQMTFEQKVSKGHAPNDKYVQVVCAYKSEADTWKYKQKNVRIPDGQNEDQVVDSEIKRIQATA